MSIHGTIAELGKTRAPFIYCTINLHLDNVCLCQKILVRLYFRYKDYGMNEKVSLIDGQETELKRCNVVMLPIHSLLQEM